METPFEKPPIESQEGKTSFSISTDLLRNLTVSMDRNKSEEYSTYVYEAQNLLKRIQEDGFWLPQQAEEYAKKYPGLNNALEVMRQNSLLKAIIEDKDQVMWDYPKDALDLLGVDIANLQNVSQLNESIKTIADNVHGLDLHTGTVYEGFYRLTIAKTTESGLTYSFSINIDQREKKLTFIGFQPISELKVGFADEINSSKFIRKLFESNPRTNIQIPERLRHKAIAREYRLQGSKKRELVLQEQYNPNELSGWTTSDPSRHNPENFRYIIHAVTDEARSMQLAIARLGMMREGEAIEEIQRGNVFDDPETFVKRHFISASVIDQVHRGTWGNVGVILEVPQGNIIQAANQDIGSIPNERLLQTGDRVENAADILMQTPTTSYNEVIIAGHNPDTGDTSKIKGVFVVIDVRTGEPKDKQLAARAKIFAQQRNIPLIAINEPVRAEKNLPPSSVEPSSPPKAE